MFLLGSQWTETLIVHHVPPGFSVNRDIICPSCDTWVLSEQRHNLSTMWHMGSQWTETFVHSVPPGFSVNRDIICPSCDTWVLSKQRHLSTMFLLGSQWTETLFVHHVTPGFSVNRDIICPPCFSWNCLCSLSDTWVLREQRHYLSTMWHMGSQ